MKPKHYLLCLVLLFSPNHLFADEPIGRPVNIVSIGFSAGKIPIDELESIIQRECSIETDLLILPETMQGQSTKNTQTIDGPIIQSLSKLASKKKMYIIAPIDRMKKERRLNSAVLLDRKGTIVGVYDKIFPYWSEFDLEPPVQVGDKAIVFNTDFGKLGIAICFDVNYPEIWQEFAAQGAEIVAWPSAYSAGKSLQAHAINHHYYIVTSTLKPDCLVYDMNGEKILHERSEKINITHVTLDLDRCIFHYDFNRRKLPSFLEKHGEDVVVEKEMNLEGWFMLKAKRPGVSARKLATQFGLEELRDYLHRSRREINAMRGWVFGEN
jgi:predicted amidohydrolase